ncbi:hypothetical protein ACFQV2_17695 [Actinokineospora soli]|uniref:Uncharacterized protein n=1 Tax=Actinokineospora soli TaxID=1048753 RepID=A0ABW2TNJ8_9PSEU
MRRGPAAPPGPASVPVGLDPHSVALLIDAAPDPAPVLDAVLPRIHTTRDAWRLFALVLPRLSDVDRDRVERAAAEHLATRLPDPRNHRAAIAQHTGATFHRALLDAHRDARDDVKADARAAVLAATRAADWTGVRDLLAGLARPGLLTALAAAAPAIGALGGNQAARECADAIADVARWWP